VQHLIEALEDHLDEKRIDWTAIETMILETFKQGGLQNLGGRSMKHGDHWGIKGNSLMIRVGRRELILSEWTPSYQYGKIKGKWGMRDSHLLSKVTPELLKKWVGLVKDAPTTKELRAKERENEKRSASRARYGGGSSYDF